MTKEEYSVLVESLLRGYKIEGCVIASVVDGLSLKLKFAIDKVLGIDSLQICDVLDYGVILKTDNPSEVGADRIANAVAVSNLYPNSSSIVVDFGTATTFDIVNSKREFLGGIIAPGVNTQIKSLNSSTSKLPKIDVNISRAAIGRNTTDAILSGVIRGSACMIEGLLEQCKEELGGKVITVATGGYSGLIASYMKSSFDYVCPTLTLYGLSCIYYAQKNQNSKLCCTK